MHCVVLNQHFTIYDMFTDYILSSTDSACENSDPYCDSNGSGNEECETSIEYSICTDTTIDALNDAHDSSSTSLEDVFAIRRNAAAGDYNNHETTGWDQGMYECYYYLIHCQCCIPFLRY